MTNRPDYEVFYVTETTGPNGEPKKTYHQVGIAYTHKTGYNRGRLGINILPNKAWATIPQGASLVMFPPKEKSSAEEIPAAMAKEALVQDVLNQLRGLGPSAM